MQADRSPDASSPRAVAPTPVAHRRLRSRGVVSLRTLIVAGCAAGALAAVVFAQESRRIRKIPVPASTPAPDSLAGANLPPLPDREQVVAAVRDIADAYGGERLGDRLAQDFPNRDDLLDTLRRVGQRATSLELQIESVEGVQIGDWQPLEGDASGPRRVASVCAADVRTRLAYDDPDTGVRTVRPVGRAQWQVRFVAEVSR